MGLLRVSRWESPSAGNDRRIRIDFSRNAGRAESARPTARGVHDGFSRIQRCCHNCRALTRALMTPIQLVRTLQLVDSLFPVGSFAYSDGLETATSGRALSAGLLAGWLQHFVDDVFIPCDGRAVLKCMYAFER